MTIEDISRNFDPEERYASLIGIDNDYGDEGPRTPKTMGDMADLFYGQQRDRESAAFYEAQAIEEAGQIMGEE